MNNLDIRKITPDDIEKIFKIGYNIKKFEVNPEIKEFWSKEQLNNWILSKTDICLLAEIDNQIIGFILLALHIPTGKVNFENVWIHKNYKGQGIYERLFSTGLHLSKQLGGNYICGLAKINNKASIKSLKKLGFKQGYDFTWMHREI